jgi:hypothetical protein
MVCAMMEAMRKTAAPDEDPAMVNDPHAGRSDPNPPSTPGSGGIDRLVELMFSGFVGDADLPVVNPARPAERAYAPLHQSRAASGGTYRLQAQQRVLRVQADSPATDVMTDLSRTAAVTTRPHATIDEARQAMVSQGVRALFVLEGESVVGVITSTDILGERPMLVVQQRGIRHDEVLVRHLMTPAEALEAMDLEEVLRARVGDIVASLRSSGRQHALVIEGEAASATRVVRGIFSLTQIARQLGLPEQTSHDVARTFADIEAAIGA